MCINICWEGVKKTQQCPTDTWEAMGTNWNSIWKKENKTQKPKTPPKLQLLFFALRVFKHGNKLPRETVVSPSLEAFRTQLDVSLGNLLQLTVPKQRDSTRWSADVPSKPKYLVIFTFIFNYCKLLDAKKKIKRWPNHVYFHALQWKWVITDDSPTKHMLLTVYFFFWHAVKLKIIS